MPDWNTRLLAGLLGLGLACGGLADAARADAPAAPPVCKRVLVHPGWGLPRLVEVEVIDTPALRASEEFRLTMLTKLVELHPKSIDTRMALAMHLLTTGCMDDARLELQTVLELWPHHLFARHLLDAAGGPLPPAVADPVEAAPAVPAAPPVGEGPALDGVPAEAVPAPQPGVPVEGAPPAGDVPPAAPPGNAPPAGNPIDASIPAEALPAETFDNLFGDALRLPGGT